MSGKLDQVSGSEMVTNGDKYYLVAAATSAQVTNGKGLVARLLLSGGTGSIDVYDAVGATTNHLFTTTGTALAAVGGAVELMCPCPIGIYVVTGAGTTVTVVYS